EHARIFFRRAAEAEMIEGEDSIAVDRGDLAEEVRLRERDECRGGVRKRPMNEEQRPFGRRRLAGGQVSGLERRLADRQPALREAFLLPRDCLEGSGQDW